MSKPIEERGLIAVPKLQSSTTTRSSFFAMKKLNSVQKHKNHGPGSDGPMNNQKEKRRTRNQKRKKKTKDGKKKRRSRLVDLATSDESAIVGQVDLKFPIVFICFFFPICFSFRPKTAIGHWISLSVRSSQVSFFLSFFIFFFLVPPEPTDRPLVLIIFRFLF